MSNPLTPPGSKLKFFDTTGEIWRVYVYPGFDEIMITGTVCMAVANDKSHRLLDCGNTAHYIPNTWIHLFWQVEEGDEPIFKW